MLLLFAVTIINVLLRQNIFLFVPREQVKIMIMLPLRQKHKLMISNDVSSTIFGLEVYFYQCYKFSHYFLTMRERDFF